MLILYTLALFCALLIPNQALDNGLARTPPMGWMTWQRFRCIIDCETYPNECISEKLIRRTAELMVRDGYLEAGYEYIVVDDCWMAEERDAEDRLQPDPDRFPSGIKALANYVQSLGLKFGIYEDYGYKTCAGYPGMLGYLEIDAKTFAEWEVDYIKIDGCYADLDTMEDGYAEFGRLLNETGRPIVYSCSWPAYHEPNGIEANYEKLVETCNLWRNWDDIEDSWTSVTGIIDWFSKNQDRIAHFSGPGHWNDPDMLVMGNFGLSLDQSRAQMSIWAVMAAPMLMSVDLETITPEFRDVILNRNAIAINQDPLGIMGRLVFSYQNIHVWSKPILPIVDGHHSFAIGFISYRVDGHPRTVEVPLSTLGLSNEHGYSVQNIFEVENVNVLQSDAISVRVSPTGGILLKLVPNASTR